MLLGLELGQYHAALCLTDALDDNLLCGLGCDAAEGLGRDVDVDDIAQNCASLVLARFLDGHLLVGLINIVYNGLADEHADVLALTVRYDVYIIGHTVVFTLICGDECLTDAVEHVVNRNALLLFQLLEGGKKFLIDHCGCDSLLIS